MVTFSELLTVERICCQCPAQSKKKALETVADTLANAFAVDASGADASGAEASKSDKSPPGGEPEQQISTRDLLDALISRERLGSTALGQGIALPHGRLDAVEDPAAAVVVLDNAIDFDAPDGQPVDILFGLVVPADCPEQHLKILAEVARHFHDGSLREALLDMDQPEQVMQRLLQQDRHHPDSMLTESEVETGDAENSDAGSPGAQRPGKAG